MSVKDADCACVQTIPIFAFCSQMVPRDHCRAGHVFAANTIESGPQNYLAFQSRALQLAPSNQTSGYRGDSHTVGAATAVFVIISTTVGLVMNF